MIQCCNRADRQIWEKKSNPLYECISFISTKEHKSAKFVMDLTPALKGSPELWVAKPMMRNCIPLQYRTIEQA